MDFFNWEVWLPDILIGIKEAARPPEWTPGPVGTISPFFFPQVPLYHISRSQ